MNPGGPGGSGTQFLLNMAPFASAVLGPQYNLVAFNPRGVDSNGPVLDRFYRNAVVREASSRIHKAGVANLSSRLRMSSTTRAPSTAIAQRCSRNSARGPIVNIVTEADEAVAAFAAFCHQAGYANSSFWGPSSEDVIDRLDNIITWLQNEPFPVSGLETGARPALATAFGLKARIAAFLYSSLLFFRCWRIPSQN
ncbi:hypothetical protein DL769_006669 [Monosporascus sp. CRB-8-3]|nr:hypothetical protein DL769_006669 [Monosporascus sp. CRB-8-3]